MPKKYDVLVMGAGWGGLVQAALHARDGKKVCVVEAHDRAGGCGHTFTKKGFSFCAEMQYLMECHNGGVVDRFLGEVGLRAKIKFNSLDPLCYDRVHIPGAHFRIPLGIENFERDLKKQFPKEKVKISRLFAVMYAIEKETSSKNFNMRDIVQNPFNYKNLILYGPWPAKKIFDYFKLSPELRAILASQCGNAALPPEEEPFYALYGILSGYCRSASFPKKGMGHFVDEITKYIIKQGGDIYYNSRVTKVHTKQGRVVSVDAGRRKITADVFVSNIDPAATMAMITGSKKLHYNYTMSCFTIFLGLNTHIKKFGFGKWNTWHYPDVDIDAVLRSRQNKDADYRRPFLFLSTPSYYANAGVLAPKGSCTMQIVALGNYDYFAKSKEDGMYQKEKARITKEILDHVQNTFIPSLRKHIVVQEVWSPLDFAQKVNVPKGCIYGAKLDFSNRFVKQVQPETEYSNLFFTGATAGSPGLQGVVDASMQLHKKLTS